VRCLLDTHIWIWLLDAPDDNLLRYPGVETLW